MNIAFLHPDLGLGGAERLVVDAAVALQQRGHRVTVFTTHHDPARCFEETRDGTLRVRVIGDFLPSHVSDRLRAPSAILRMLYLAERVRLWPERFDLYFCDLVAHAVPVLKLGGNKPVVFYCHFPDQLLAPSQSQGARYGGPLYRLYRRPIDETEQRAMAMADAVLVNSQFTAGVLARTFPRVPPAQVVYPGVRVSDVVESEGADTRTDTESATFEVLCLSRFEAKKNLPLALSALARLRELVPAHSFARVRLVVAGGYDVRMFDQRQVLQQLSEQAQALGLSGQVRFVCSPEDAERDALVRDCACLMFTADNEHFGFVPVEAMAAGKPVIAARSGGPLETVVDGETGFLRPSEPDAFARCLAELLDSPALSKKLGRAGRQRARAFSREAFASRLCAVIERAAGRA